MKSFVVTVISLEKFEAVFSFFNSGVNRSLIFCFFLIEWNWTRTVFFYSEFKKSLLMILWSEIRAQHCLVTIPFLRQQMKREHVLTHNFVIKSFSD